MYNAQAGCVSAPQTPSTEYRYSSAAVASDSLICSQVGRDILENRGGSAVDAAVATLFCMGVSNFQSMGIGGDVIATIYDRQSEKVCVLDAREMAPGLSRDDMFVANPDKASSGGLSVAVPGAVAGCWAMHERSGRLPWADLLQPAIDMCERGFPMTPAVRRAAMLPSEDPLTDGLNELLYSNVTRKELRKEGEIIRWPKLAETLRVLAREGGEAFYRGPLAKSLVEDIREEGGIIREKDFARYAIKWREPVVTSLSDGCKMYAAPPPADGAVLSLMLNILRGYDLNEDSMSTPESSVLTYHRVIEAMKFAFAQRQHTGDPDFTDVVKIQQRMTSPEFGDYLRARIDDTMTFGVGYYGDTPYREVKPGTAHLSLIDSDGNAVSATATVNCRFGSKVVGRQTGVLFNNSMDDFCSPNLTNQFLVEPFTANYIEPYKRPISSKSPVIILKGDNTVKLVTGAAGGTTICSTILQVILRSLYFGQGLAASSDAPRAHHQLLPNQLFVEDSFPKEILDGLKTKGHDVRVIPPRWSVAQSILVNGPEVIAVSDNRKGGEPDGYRATTTPPPSLP